MYFKGIEGFMPVVCSLYAPVARLAAPDQVHPVQPRQGVPVGSLAGEATVPALHHQAEDTEWAGRGVSLAVGAERPVRIPTSLHLPIPISA